MLPQMIAVKMIRDDKDDVEVFIRMNAFSHLQCLIKTCVSQVRDQSSCRAYEARLGHEKNPLNYLLKIDGNACALRF